MRIVCITLLWHRGTQAFGCVQKNYRYRGVHQDTDQHANVGRIRHCRLSPLLGIYNVTKQYSLFTRPNISTIAHRPYIYHFMGHSTEQHDRTSKVTVKPRNLLQNLSWQRLCNAPWHSHLSHSEEPCPHIAKAFNLSKSDFLSWHKLTILLTKRVLYCVTRPQNLIVITVLVRGCTYFLASIGGMKGKTISP